MSSVDERIVEMQFNNAQFESGVHTSINSLERLKQSLNLESSVKSFNSLDAAGRSFSLANVADNVQTVANRFSALGIIGDQVIRKLTTSAMGLGQKVLNAIPRQIIEGGKARAQNIEKAQFTLKGLLQDSYDWKTIKDDLLYAVSGTAYGIDDAAKAASQLVASNVKFGTEMKSALRGISGVAAMTNSEYGEIAHIFTTAAGLNKLTTENINSLAMRGLNVAAELGKRMGKSEQEIRQMVSKGKIDFKTFAKYMDEAFGEHATKANETFSGSLANVKASLSRMGEKFATPGFAALTKIFNALLPVMGDIENMIQPIADKFSVLAGIVSDKVVSALEKLHRYFNGIKTFSEVLRGTFDNTKKGIEDGKNIVKSALELFTKKTPEDPMKKYAKHREWASKKMDKLLGLEDAHNEALSKTGTWSQRVSKMMSPLIGNLAKVTGSIMGLNTKELDKIYKHFNPDWFKKLTESLNPFNKKMGEAKFSLSSFLGITDKTSKKKNPFSKLFEYGKTTKQKMQELLGIEEKHRESLKQTGKTSAEIEKYAHDVIEGLYGNGEARVKALNAIEEGLFPKVQNKVNELLGCSKRWAVAEGESTEATEENAEKTSKLVWIFDGLLDVLSGLFSAFHIVASAAASFWNILLKPAALGILSTLGGGLLSIFSFIGRKLVELDAKLTDSNFFVNTFQKFSDSIAKAKNGIIEFGQKVSQLPGIQRLKVAFDNLKESAKALAGNIWTKITNTFASLGMNGSIFHLPTMENLLSAVDKIANKISEIIDKITGKDSAGNVFERMRDKVLDPFKALTGDKVKKDVKKFFKQFEDGSVEVLKSGFSFEVIAEKVRNIFGGKGKKGQAGESQEGVSGFIDGIVTSLTGGTDAIVTKVSSIVKAIIAGCTDAFNSINWETVMDVTKTGTVGWFLLGAKGLLTSLSKSVLSVSSQLAIGLGKFFDSLSKTIESFQKIPEGINKVLTSAAETLKGFGESVDKVAKAIARRENSKALLNVAFAIAVLAGSLWVLSKIPFENLKTAGVALAGIATGLMVLYFAFVKISNMRKVTEAAAGSGKGSVLDPIANSLNGLIDSAKGLLKSAKLAVLGAGLILIAAGLVAVALALAILSKIKIKITAKNIGTFIAVFAAIGLMAVAARIAGKGAAGLGLSMILISASLLLMTVALKQLSKITAAGKDYQRAMNVMIGFIVATGIIVALGARLGGENVGKFGSTFLKVSTALLILAGAIMLISGIEKNALTKAMVAIGILTTIIGVILICLEVFASDKNTVDAKAIEALGKVISTLVKALLLLAFVPVDKLAPAVIALVSIMGTLGLLLVGVSKMGEMKGIAKSVIAIGLILLGLCAALGYLNTLDNLPTLEEFAGIALILGVIGIILYALKGNDWKSGISSAISVGLLMVAIAGAMAIMNGNTDLPSLEQMEGISLLLGTCGGVVRLLMGVPWTAGATAAANVVEFIGILGLVFGGVTGLLGVVNDATNGAVVDDIEKGTEVLNAIGDAIGGFFGSIIGSFVGEFTTSKLSAEMKEINTFMSQLDAFMRSMDSYDVEKTTAMLTNATNISESIKALKSIKKTGLFEKKDTDTDSTSFLDTMNDFADGIASFSEKIDKIDFKGAMKINVISKLLESIGTAMDSMPREDGALGGLVGKKTSLSTFAEELSNSAENIVTFANTMKDGDFSNVDTAMQAVKKIAEAAAEIPNQGDSLATWVMGDNTLSVFGEELKAFAPSLNEFSEAVAGKDFKGIKPAMKAVKQIAKVAAEIPNQGESLAKWIMGDNTLSMFGEELNNFAPELVNFAEKVNGIKADDVKPAMQATKDILDVAKDMPNEGGFISLLLGDNTMKQFGHNLNSFGYNFGRFAANTKDVDKEQITNAIEAIQEIATLGENFDEGGGLAGLLKMFGGGNNVTNMEKFGNALAALGEGIGALSVDGIDISGLTTDLSTLYDTIVQMGQSNLNGADLMYGINDALTELAENGLKALNDALNSDTTTKSNIGVYIDGLISAITAKTPFLRAACISFVNEAYRTFEQANAAFLAAGKANAESYMQGFQSGGEESGAAEAVEKTVNSALSSKKGSNNGSDAGKQFSKGLAASAASVKASGKDLVNAAVSALDVGSGEYTTKGKVSGENYGKGITSTTGKAKSAATNVGNNAKKAITILANTFKAPGATSGGAYSSGVSSKRAAARSAGAALGAAAKSGASGGKSQMYSIGASVGSGFVSGIASKVSSAVAKARELVQKAIAAAKKAGEVNSPSKKMIPIGEAMVEGYNLGMTRLMGSAEKTSKSFVTSSISSANSALSQLSYILANGIDDAPVITPVLDLSDIQNGAGLINGMLNTGPNLHLGAISASMDYNRSLGDPTANAIENLTKQIAGMQAGGDTYQINGITYDDGSNISDAIRTLTRAARVGRRA